MTDPRPDKSAEREAEWRQQLCEGADHLLAALKAHRRGDVTGARCHVIAAGLAVEQLLANDPTLF